MYKLKIKRTNQSCYTTLFFNTLQEVADHLSFRLGVESLSDMMKLVNEFNFRFYLSYKAN